jgi:cell division septum initiation protein DivIVA
VLTRLTQENKQLLEHVSSLQQQLAESRLGHIEASRETIAAEQRCATLTARCEALARRRMER